ncbi:MAG: WecB/TagA/CpsF family glycosyltransferase, partial [Clostridia bacterium]|nr:WecB/TagA/CpsF family glycosyltransferase [Clostridia bacterium]
KILGTPLKKGRVPGIELFERIVSLSGKNGWRIFLLGGKPGVADTAAQKLREKYPDMILAGTNDGYFGNDSAPVIEKINAANVDFLAVCLGVPKQEEWMKEHRSGLNVPLMGGFGGSLDVFAGNVRRAPEIFRKLSCEWLYRLIKEPYRIGRMMKLPKFIMGAVKDKITGKKY